MPRRSLLYSPADRPELMRKAPDAGADAICFDLEDAVAPARTDEARAAVREVLTDPGFDPAAEVSVRLTGEEPGVDLAAIAGPEARHDAVMIPKAESAAAAARVAALCRDHDAPPTVLAVVETAAGVLSARAIAGAEATDAVLFGAEDLSADLGATRTVYLGFGSLGPTYVGFVASRASYTLAFVGLAACTLAAALLLVYLVVTAS